MDIFNTTLLLVTIAYGFSFGIMNIIKKIVYIISLVLSVLVGGNPTLNQSDAGKILDGMFLTSVLYFATIGKPFIMSILESVN